MIGPRKTGANFCIRAYLSLSDENLLGGVVSAATKHFLLDEGPVPF
jgi:hypothetical protein